jgi:glycosyltransferase involved in cell wall biosynthesis
LNEPEPREPQAAPVVSVGIPTYNRADGLRRALDSVLGQSERELEVIVSDNASTDATSEVIAGATAHDPRIRAIRQERNVGLTANFNAVLQAARGRYVMVLADDDWIEPDYVARCRASLDADERLALVSGSALYHTPDGATFPGTDIDLQTEDPARRVRDYFATVTDNVCIYGLIRRSLLERALPMRNCLAGDWLLIGRLAFLGSVRTDPATHVHRSSDGTSANFERTVARMGLTRFEADHPHLAIMRFIHEDIARDSPVYESLPARERRRLATRSAAQVARTRPLGLVVDELPPRLANSRLAALARRLRRP